MKKTSTCGLEILLALVMMARGTSFIFSKLLLETMSTFNVLALRFGIAFLVLAALFARRLYRASRKVWLAGFLIGFLYFLVMALELTALTMADTGPVALTEHTSIVMVPLTTAALARVRPNPVMLLSAFLAVTGVGMLTLPGGNFSAGLLIALLGAVCYTVTIIVTDRLTHIPAEGFAVGIIQLGTLALLAGIPSLFLESPHSPSSPAQWGMLAVLVVVCTIFGFTFQPVAQARVSAEMTGILAALNPAVAAIIGALVLQEQFGWLGALAVVLILIAITLPSWLRILTPKAGKVSPQ
ncbi:DMT family transporter [Varibaculum cambriense]|uniref:DMT family transporter n=1 Tax=Varibaculum cambriense TaxID=184870 RepID=UPI00241DE5C0|nr:DMT family transporter [Varibaculum cambriense]MBS5944775.1 DMT family transporter [Varibaculum cambriense]